MTTLETIRTWHTPWRQDNTTLCTIQIVAQGLNGQAAQGIQREVDAVAQRLEQQQLELAQHRFRRTRLGQQLQSLTVVVEEFGIGGLPLQQVVEQLIEIEGAVEGSFAQAQRRRHHFQLIQTLELTSPPPADAEQGEGLQLRLQ